MSLHKMEALENCFLVFHAEFPSPLQNLTLRGALCARVFLMVMLCQEAHYLDLLTFRLLILCLQLPNRQIQL